jgi:hypothetical protein
MSQSDLVLQVDASRLIFMHFSWPLVLNFGVAAPFSNFLAGLAAEF